MALHRLFFALLPTEPARSAIAARARACAEDGGQVRTDRLHMTLAITPDYEAWPQGAAEGMAEIAEGIAAAPAPVVLDRISARGKVIVLQPGRPAASLRDLQHRLESGMRRRGLLRPGWSFHPHVTLTYGHRGTPFGGRIAPIAWDAHDFVLIDSHLGLTHHEHLGRWPLRSVQGALF